MHILVNNSLRKGVKFNRNQGDLFSLVLFSIIMNRIMSDVKKTDRGYRLDKGSLKIICYADDAVIMVKEEDAAQFPHFSNTI